jgi:predicted transcriptional regulator
MRIGKIQKKILKILYKEELRKKNTKTKDRWYYQGLRPKEIVEKITKLKYPQEEKDYGITQSKKWNRIMIYVAGFEKIKDPKQRERIMNADPMTKKFEEIAEIREKWHKESTAIYRAIKILSSVKKYWLIEKVQSRWNYKRYKLTESGRRIISHRFENDKIK